jgi:hypothetical protein
MAPYSYFFQWPFVKYYINNRCALRKANKKASVLCVGKMPGEYVEIMISSSYVSRVGLNINSSTLPTCALFSSIETTVILLNVIRDMWCVFVEVRTKLIVHYLCQLRSLTFILSPLVGEQFTT